MRGWIAVGLTLAVLASPRATPARGGSESIDATALPAARETAVRRDGNLLRFSKRIGVAAGDHWTGWMSFVAFSQDGRMVASDGPAPQDETGGLTLWSFPDGRFVRRLSFRPWALSRDWKTYASDRALIDVESGKTLIALTEHDDERARAAFSDDGRFVAFYLFPRRANEKRVRVLRISDGSVVNQFGARALCSLAFRPGGETLATGHWDNVTLWNVRHGDRIALLRGFGRYVAGVGFNADGSLLAAGTDAGGVQIWNVERRQRLLALDIGGGEVSDPVFSPDGRLVAVGIYGTGAAWVIDVASGKIVGKAQVSGIGCGSVAFSPDGKYLIAPSTGGLITWPYDRGGTIRVFDVARADR